MSEPEFIWLGSGSGSGSGLGCLYHLEGKVYGDRLELRLLVAVHRLYVLVEPRVPPREGPDRQRAERELRGGAAHAGQARLQQRVALVGFGLGLSFGWGLRFGLG